MYWVLLLDGLWGAWNDSFECLWLLGTASSCRHPPPPQGWARVTVSIFLQRVGAAAVTRLPDYFRVHCWLIANPLPLVIASGWGKLGLGMQIYRQRYHFLQQHVDLEEQGTTRVPGHPLPALPLNSCVTPDKSVALSGCHCQGEADWYVGQRYLGLWSPHQQRHTS